MLNHLELIQIHLLISWSIKSIKNSFDIFIRNVVSERFKIIYNLRERQTSTAVCINATEKRFQILGGKNYFLGTNEEIDPNNMRPICKMKARYIIVLSWIEEELIFNDLRY